MILLYYFRFRQLFERAMLKNQNQKIALCACADFFLGAQSIKNAAEDYKKKNRGFFGWVKIWKIMYIHMKCCVIKFPKIRKKVFYNCSLGGWTKLNNEYISNPTSLKLSFAPGHGMFHGKRCILGHPNVHILYTYIVLYSCTVLVLFFSSFF